MTHATTSESSNHVSYASMASEWIPCPVCDGNDFEELTREDRYRMGLPTCQCRGCGLTMTNPVPTEEALGRFYRDDYRKYYRKVDRPSEQHIEEYGLGQRAAYTSRFLEQAGLLGGSPRVLDVGCADGSLLRGIGSRAPNSTRFGIEPNPLFGDFARGWAGATVYRELDDVERFGGCFDLITVNHVLEHVREPVTFLRRLSALLGNEGSMYVDVPDAARYKSLDDLHIAHLYHFSQVSLDKIARRAGLVTRHLEKHSPTRHPLSVRAVFRRDAATVDETGPDPEASLVRQRIRRISLLAPAFRFRRTALGQTLLAGPMRVLRRMRAG